MDQTKALLSSIAQSARTGAEATDQLMGRTQDMNMRQELMFQRDQYYTMQQQAEKQLTDLGESPHYDGPMSKMGMWAGINMNTALDKSNSHLADIMIEGVTMGIIDATKARSEFSEANAEAQGIASQFITTQQDAIERMKQFL